MTTSDFKKDLYSQVFKYKLVKNHWIDARFTKQSFSLKAHFQSDALSDHFQSFLSNLQTELNFSSLQNCPSTFVVTFAKSSIECQPGKFFLLLVLPPSKFLFPWQLQFLIVNVLLSDPVLGRFGFNSTIGSLFLGPFILHLLFLSLNRFFFYLRIFFLNKKVWENNL